MDKNNPISEAVFVQNRLIVSVGSNEQINELVDEYTQVIDLDGRTLLPGFIDSHSHWFGDGEDYHQNVEHLLRNGYTTVTELFSTPEIITRITDYDTNNDVKVRVNLYLRLNWGNWGEGNDVYIGWHEEYLPGQMLTDKIRVAGVKFFADGVGGTRTMALREPYTDNPENRGVLFWTQEELNNVVKAQHDKGYQIAIHAMGDAAVEQVLNAYEYALDGESNSQYRHRIEHCCILADDLLNRFTDLGIIASMQGDWYSSDDAVPPSWYDYLGEERKWHLGRIRDLLDRGIPTVINTDYPYCFKGKQSIYQLYTSVSRIGIHWKYPVPEWEAAQRITVNEALELMTIKGAYALGLEDVIGSVEAGKYADLIVLSANPLEIETEDLLNLHVWLTMINGEIEYWEETHQSYCLDVKVQGNGTTSYVPDEYVFAPGHPVTIKAVPWNHGGAEGEFYYWILNGEVIEETEISIVVDKNHNLTAVFKELGYKSTPNCQELLDDYNQLRNEYEPLLSENREMMEQIDQLNEEVEVLKARIEAMEKEKEKEIPSYPPVTIILGVTWCIGLLFIFQRYRPQTSSENATQTHSNNL